MHSIIIIYSRNVLECSCLARGKVQRLHVVSRSKATSLPPSELANEAHESLRKMDPPAGTCGPLPQGH